MRKIPFVYTLNPISLVFDTILQTIIIFNIFSNYLIVEFEDSRVQCIPKTWLFQNKNDKNILVKYQDLVQMFIVKTRIIKL
jgi:hypothetical protein